MRHKKWTLNEVVSYLESKILDDIASDEELEMYEDYKWNGKIDKNNYTYIIKKLLNEMNKEYKGE